MLKKIISGGQTGADQAALDVAIKFNIPHGGWIPKGRLTENGPLDLKYQLTEMTTKDYRKRTKKNIEESHGTVIISRGELTGGSKLTLYHAKLINRPRLYLDLLATEDFEAAIFLKSFILENQIGILNVAGPRASHHPGIYADVKTILETTLYLLFLDIRKDVELKQFLPANTDDHSFPETISEATDIICRDLSLKSKVFIARHSQMELMFTYFAFLEYVRSRTGLDAENTILLEACRKNSGSGQATIEDAVMVILKELKNHLEKDYLLRVVK